MGIYIYICTCTYTCTCINRCMYRQTHLPMHTCVRMWIVSVYVYVNSDARHNYKPCTGLSQRSNRRGGAAASGLHSAAYLKVKAVSNSVSLRPRLPRHRCHYCSRACGRRSPKGAKNWQAQQGSPWITPVCHVTLQPVHQSGNSPVLWQVLYGPQHLQILWLKSKQPARRRRRMYLKMGSEVVKPHDHVPRYSYTLKYASRW